MRVKNAHGILYFNIKQNFTLDHPCMPSYKPQQNTDYQRTLSCESVVKSKGVARRETNFPKVDMQQAFLLGDANQPQLV